MVSRFSTPHKLVTAEGQAWPYSSSCTPDLSTSCGPPYRSSHIGGQKRRKVAGLNSRSTPKAHPLRSRSQHRPLDTPRSGYTGPARMVQPLVGSADSDKSPARPQAGGPDSSSGGREVPDAADPMPGPCQACQHDPVNWSSTKIHGRACRMRPR